VSIELDACKFCGAKAVPNYYRGDHWVTCPHCKVGTATFGSAERAAASWNRRAQPAEEVQPVADERDAARYRWLKSQCGQEHHSLLTVQHELDGIVSGADLDEAIDSARAALCPPAAGDKS